MITPGRLFLQLVCIVVIISMISGCFPSQVKKATESLDRLDDDPQTLVVYAYIHYPGIPHPTKSVNDKYCALLPSLLVWGDGLAFLDEKLSNDPSSMLSGYLSSSTLNTLFDILDSNNFFSEWQPSPPNPSGTFMKIGAQRKGKPAYEHTTNGATLSYLQLIDTIKPVLNPLPGQKNIDLRIESILKEDENCNEYIYSR